MKRALLLVCLALPLSVACGSSPDPVEPSQTSAPTAAATGAPATTGAPAADKPTTCTDDQNCVEQGALATMVGDKDKAKVLYKLGCEKQPKGKSCEKLAELEGKPAETKPAETKKDEGKGLPGANVTIGSVTNDGMQLKDISCIVKNGGGAGGLLGSLTVVAGLSKKKQALDACSKGQTETRVHFFQAGGKVTKVQAEASDPKVKACVEKALVGAPATTEAECAATVVHGK